MLVLFFSSIVLFVFNLMITSFMATFVDFGGFTLFFFHKLFVLWYCCNVLDVYAGFLVFL